MFELLDDDTPSPSRMPSSPTRRTLGEGNLNGYLFIVAFGGLVIGENLRALRVAQIVVWLVAGCAGWWFFYRFFQQIEAGWRRDPTRRTRLLGGSVLSVLVLLTSAYLVAIRFKIPGWVFLIVIAVDWHFRLRRRESP
jgi:hypothetical protein